MMTTTAIATLSIAAVLEILFIVGKWNLFKKMGLAGWKALVPVYSEYLIFKKTWNEKMFLVALISAIAGSEFMYFATYGAHVNVVLAALGFVFGTVATVIDITLLYKLAKSFGHGVGYTFGLLVAEPLFMTVLGLGKSEYARA